MYLPQPQLSTVAVPPPGDGPGFWAGAPSAVATDDAVYLAYRLRRPLAEGRGYAVVVARSVDDGAHFEPLLTITKDQMRTESLERPTLVRTPSGRWRLYLSCATYGTKHWRVELLEADRPDAFDPATAKVVLPGDLKTGVKDPVIVHHDGIWHLWASCHPLEIPAEADQMVTDYATSQDGLEWSWQGTALDRRPWYWDSRGVRVSTVRFTPAGVLAFYDGRASALENYEERTGVAIGPDPSTLTAVGTEPHASSVYGGLRYLDIVPLPDGRTRIYYEWTRSDGAHELRTEVRLPGLPPEGVPADSDQ